MWERELDELWKNTHHPLADAEVSYLQPSLVAFSSHLLPTPSISSPQNPDLHSNADRTRTYRIACCPHPSFSLSAAPVNLRNLGQRVCHIFQSSSVRMWSVVWFGGGGCPVGRRIRFLFPAPTHSALGGD